MDKTRATYFFKQVSKTFEFLVNEHSFVGPHIDLDEAIGFTFVTFTGNNLAIECSLDEREGDVTCIIARVVNGNKATFRDAVDEKDTQGVVVREHLSKMLARKGARGRLFNSISGLSDAERIKVTLSDFAQMLRDHGKEILDDSPMVFER